ncbi:MAG: hypothetical protein HFJ53_08170 [Clostridia bacterium]|jgi:hypothetical protein|nr:hypothetical protein [Clostridia bacterium]
MIVLNKKRVILVLSCVFVAIFTYMFSTELNRSETIQTVSLPVSNKVVVLDARTSEYQMKEHKVAMEQQKHKQT